MAKYVVVALSMGGTSKRIFSFGDIVTENDLNDTPQELIAKGFIESDIDAFNKRMRAKNAEHKDVDSDDSGKSGSDQTTDDEDEGADLFTKAEIIAALDDQGKEYNKNATKADLYKIWKG